MKTPTIERLKKLLADADAHGSKWLADGNEAMERGNKEKAEAYYVKGQYWMDRSNALRERIDISKATGEAQ